MITRFEMAADTDHRTHVTYGLKVPWMATAARVAGGFRRISHARVIEIVVPGKPKRVVRISGHSLPGRGDRRRA